MSKLRAQVKEFHRVFDQPIVETPTVPSDERVRLRARLIAEEFFEVLLSMCARPELGEYGGSARQHLDSAHKEVMRLIDWMPVGVDLPELADGLADLDYVVEGTRIECGIDGGPIADEVHRSNMAKAVLIYGVPRAHRRQDGKILKPDSWTAPDIEGELKKQGWKGRSE